MSEVKRYDPGCDYAGQDEMVESVDGVYVKYSDYAALKAERDALATKPIRRLTLPAGYTMNCEPTRYIAVNEVAQLLRGLGFAVDVEEADE